MSIVHATFLSSENVVLYCQNCSAQVDTIHSKEVLPLMMFLSSHNEQVLCADCDPLPDSIPMALYPMNDDWVILKNGIAYRLHPETWKWEMAETVACLVNHNSNDVGESEGK